MPWIPWTLGSFILPLMSLLASSYALYIQHLLRPDTNREAHALLVYIHHPYTGQRGCVSACRNHRVINGARRAGGRAGGRVGGMGEMSLMGQRSIIHPWK